NPFSDEKRGCRKQNANPTASLLICRNPYGFRRNWHQRRQSELMCECVEPLHHMLRIDRLPGFIGPLPSASLDKKYSSVNGITRYMKLSDQIHPFTGDFIITIMKLKIPEQVSFKKLIKCRCLKGLFS